MEPFEIEMPNVLKEIQRGPKTHTFGELLKICIFEFLGTMLFAYGILCSGGKDVYISIYLYAAITITAKFSGGHVKSSSLVNFKIRSTPP